MKHVQFTFIIVLFSFISFSQNKFSETITKEEIKEHVYYLASDELEGRDTGKPGQKKAAEYIANQFKTLGLKYFDHKSGLDYYQYFTIRGNIKTENILGYIEAKDKDAEWIVITAHYDHLGKTGNKIFKGADDNASGTTALIEIAKACSIAKQVGIEFNKNILFIAFSGEEKGLLGSEYFVSSDIAEALDIALNINMDMIGKSIRYGVIETFKNRNNPDFTEDTTLCEDYVYLTHKGAQTGKYSKYSKKAGKHRNFKVDKTPGLILRIGYKNGSDHKPFYESGIPIMVYFTGLHPDYHTERDTPDKIDYENLTVITKIIFETVYKICTE